MQTQNQTSTNTVRIVAAVLDTRQLKLYKPDGQSITLNQGQAGFNDILSKVNADILQQRYSDIDLTAYTVNDYKEFEENSSGVVKFFKVAKTKLTKLFRPWSSETKDTDPVPSNHEVISEIMSHAVPVADASFNENSVAKQANVVEEGNVTPGQHNKSDEPDTIVAMVDNTLVPGMERIKTQFTRANALGSTQGMENFLKRLASVIHKRSHSVEDLLKFLERGDLPIAEDGSILIYKVLRKSDGKYVDCHTRKVPQQIGSYVCMDESLVDHNRNNECSNGLHVARRGYIAHFGGDVCTLCKLNPEDVIAVPEYDANKMRVCGYHILFELTPEMYSLVKSNRPISECEAGQIMLGKAMTGDHVGILEDVKITGHMGGGVSITPRTEPVKAITTQEAPRVTALSNPAEETKEAPVDPKKVYQEVASLSRKDKAKALFDAFQHATDPEEKATALKALVDFKKAAKVGWDTLGIDYALIAGATPVNPISTPSSPKTPREQIQHLLPLYKQAVGAEKTEFAKDIMKLKQQAKKAWNVLGVPDHLVESIKLRAK